MEHRQSNLLKVLKDVQKFLDEQAERLGWISASGSRKTLDQAIAQLAEAAALQSGSEIAAKSATRRHHMLVRALVNDHMVHIARIAAIELQPLPDITALAMPKSRRTGERLVAAARGMAAEAAKYESVFIEAGLPIDFLAQFRAAVEAVAASISERQQRQAARSGARDVLEKKLDQARKVMRILDGFVKTNAKEDSAIIAAWKVVKRQRRPASKFGPVPSAPITTGGTA